MDELNLASLPATCLLTIHLSSIESFLPLDLVRNLSSSANDNSLPTLPSRFTRSSDNSTFEQQRLSSDNFAYYHRETLNNLTSLSTKLKRAMLVVSCLGRATSYIDTQVDHLIMEQKEVSYFSSVSFDHV